MLDQRNGLISCTVYVYTHTRCGMHFLVETAQPQHTAVKSVKDESLTRALVVIHFLTLFKGYSVQAFSLSEHAALWDC